MKTKTNGSSARASVVALRVALVAMALAVHTDRAAAQSAQELSKPTSTVEVGVGDVTQGSYKAGEYNGLQDKGAYFLGNVDLRGGASFDSAGTFRWRIKGTDLGLESRNVSAQAGVPGKYQINFGYDELRRNRSDSYQTPYNGTGTNTLTLPGTWLVPTVAGSGGANVISARGLVRSIGTAPYISTLAANNGAIVSPTAGQIALVDAAAGADGPLFHNVNLFTKRTKYDAGFNVNFSERWGFDADFQPEHKDGMKPMGTVSRNSAATGGGSLGDYLIGLSANVPLNDRVALYTLTTYMHPSASAGPAGFDEESWNFTIGLALYPARNARSNTVAGQCWMPLLPVANNGLFLVDTNRTF